MTTVVQGLNGKAQILTEDAVGKRTVLVSIEAPNSNGLELSEDCALELASAIEYETRKKP